MATQGEEERDARKEKGGERERKKAARQTRRNQILPVFFVATRDNRASFKAPARKQTAIYRQREKEELLHHHTIRAH